ncbi:SUMF1/EgtB/PvdO family nonheme iron enzyme [Candidatus Uabimicrobium amorphum]|uniref:Sulfatase-modifying factor enzyme domain-containing protein n=1 Tax=Uabimicrobium amorphum TaxID=2596890 RepID=A0A5S9IQK2_UABAM|nr:SUMF1/EgtB/PvdO family nonheme iron enzyme [Candidatus Uabimicrobium amorphum]BBM86249.1 hypothetical protein UABAM_04635 [Candidatus Uabimicrobium amorphum]
MKQNRIALAINKSIQQQDMWSWEKNTSLPQYMQVWIKRGVTQDQRIVINRWLLEHHFPDAIPRSQHHIAPVDGSQHQLRVDFIEKAVNTCDKKEPHITYHKVKCSRSKWWRYTLLTILSCLCGYLLTLRRYVPIINNSRDIIYIELAEKTTPSNVFYSNEYGFRARIDNDNNITIQDDNADKTLASWRVSGIHAQRNLRAITLHNDTIWAVGNRIILSSNDGKNWDYHQMYTRECINDIYSDGKITWCVGDGGAIYRGDGANWQRQDNIPFAHFRAICGEQNKLWVLGDNGTLLYRENHAKKWESATLPVTEDMYDFHVDDLDIWCVGSGGLLCYSMDGGITWQQVYVGSKDWHSIVKQGQKICVAGAEGQIAYSHDNGQTWNLPFSGSENNFYQLTAHDDHLWCVGEGQIYFSMDFGQTWVLQIATAESTVNGCCYDAKRKVLWTCGDYTAQRKHTIPEPFLHIDYHHQTQGYAYATQNGLFVVYNNRTVQKTTTEIQSLAYAKKHHLAYSDQNGTYLLNILTDTTQKIAESSQNLCFADNAVAMTIAKRVILYSLVTKRTIEVFVENDVTSISNIAISDSAQWLAIQEGHNILIYSIANGQRKKVLTASHASCIDFVREKLVYSDQHQLFVYDIVNDKTQVHRAHQANIYAISTFDNYIASVDHDQLLNVWRDHLLTTQQIPQVDKLIMGAIISVEDYGDLKILPQLAYIVDQQIYTQKLDTYLLQKRLEDAKILWPVDWENLQVNLQIRGSEQVRIHENTQYEIVLRNNETRTLRDLILQCTLPEGVVFINSNPSGTQQQSIRSYHIDAISELDTYKINLTLCMRKTGNHKINVLLLAQKREVKDVSLTAEAQQIPQNWDSKLWELCWNTQQEYIDFTVDEWAKLSHEKQVELARSYQDWYAKEKGLELMKVLKRRGQKFKFRMIPPGKFWMGSIKGEKDEVRHKVWISKVYWVGETEVTQGQWQTVIKDNPSRFKDVGVEGPVEQVSWEECQQFCDKVGMRLLTEAEWEYACRAGTTRTYNLGDSVDSDKINYRGREFRKKTTAVKSLANMNSWGCYDFHGNVWEWCSDWYNDYGTTEQRDPKGSIERSLRVFRGGSWYNWIGYCRSARRYGSRPGSHRSYLGLRLCISGTKVK